MSVPYLSFRDFYAMKNVQCGMRSAEFRRHLSVKACRVSWGHRDLGFSAASEALFDVPHEDIFKSLSIPNNVLDYFAVNSEVRQGWALSSLSLTLSWNRF